MGWAMMALALSKGVAPADEGGVVDEGGVGQ
jgi:hypothetical protein